MNWRSIMVWAGGAVLMAAAWRAYGWAGVALAGGGVLMWLLLHFTRLMQALKRAADHPLGHVGSAVMLNAKLRPGVNLLHVVALTRSLGQLLSPPDEQPELYRWTDGSASHVTCEFHHGRLLRWELVRPAAGDGAATTEPGSASP